MNHTTLAMLGAAIFAGAHTFASVSLPPNPSAEIAINIQLFVAPLCAAAGALLLTLGLIQRKKSPNP
jgi:hypothetical protein